MAHRETLDVQLVENCPVPRDVRSSVVAPIEPVVHDEAPRNARGAVARIGALFAAIAFTPDETEERVPVVDLALEGSRVRVHEQLVPVEAVAFVRSVRTEDPVAVPLTRPYPREVSVPDVGVALDERRARLLSTLVEKAYRHPLRVLGEEREVRAM